MIRHWLILGLFLTCGCAVDIPWLHRADSKSIYATKYFTVKPPVGTGWEFGNDVPSFILSRYFNHETDLFDEVVPGRLGFRKYTVADLWPHPPGRDYYIAFYAVPADPERFHYDGRLMAEAENDKVLPKPLPPAFEEKLGVRWGKRRIDEVSISSRQFFEFEYQTTGDPACVSLQYIHLSRDLKVLYVIEVPYARKGAGFPPKDVKTIIEGFEPLELDLSPANLAMERAAQVLHELTLVNILCFYNSRQPDAGQIARAITDLTFVVEKEPRNYRAHLFLGALNLIQAQRDAAGGRMAFTTHFPRYLNPQSPFFLSRGIEHQGLWDFYYITKDDRVFSSLLLPGMDATKALAHFREALEIKPDSFWANYYVAGLSVGQGECGRAIAQCRAMIEVFPEGTLGWYMLGLAYKGGGDMENALEAFKIAKRKNRKDDIFPDYGMGYLLGGRENFDRQIKSVEQLIKSRP